MPPEDLLFSSSEPVQGKSILWNGRVGKRHVFFGIRQVRFSNIRRGGATIRRALTGASQPASPPIPPDGRERSNRAA
jgi:hypothetical protein